MTAGEAVGLAGTLPGTTVVPVHYDMFSQNVAAGATSTFTEHAAAAGLTHRLLEVGEHARFRATEGRHR